MPFSTDKFTMCVTGNVIYWQTCFMILGFKSSQPGLVFFRFSIIILTPPWTVPSPVWERRRVERGASTPPRKENYATETCTTNENNTSVLEEAGPGLPGRMTCCGESRKEATMPMTLLSTRKTLNIGTWNVRTMYEAGKTAPVTAEMRRFNLAVLGLCETRWTQSGQLRLTTGELILYSGHEEEDAPHSEGVGLLLRKEAQKALIGWEARGSRIITACFKTKNKKIKMNIVQCYAPTNDKTDETKEEFYNQLHGIMSNLGDKNVNVIMGDFNAKMGSDNQGYENVMGVHGVGVMNDNGERFVKQITLWLEEVYSLTREYTRQLGYHLTKSLKIG